MTTKEKQAYIAAAEAAKLSFVQGGGCIVELAPEPTPKIITAR